MSIHNDLAKLVMGVVVGLIVIALLMRSCDDGPETTVTVPLQGVTLSDTTPEVRTITRPGIEAAMRELISRYQDSLDVLRRRIAALGGRTVFVTDTLLVPADPTVGGEPDTIRIECDETNRRIDLRYGFAPRIVTVQGPRSPFLEGVAEGGFAYDFDRLVPRVAVGALLNITDRMSVQVAVETQLASGSGMETALTTDLRWKF